MIKTQRESNSGSKGVDTILSWQYNDWQLDFINSSFYLPLEVLRDTRFIVSPIRVITGDQYETLASLAHSGDNSKVLLSNDGASRRMLSNAHSVGVSERLILQTQEIVLVCKLWYGCEPVVRGKK